MTVTTMDDRLRATLGAPELDWLVARVRHRLARGQPVAGTVTLRDPTAAQRAAVEALLGRRPGRGTVLTVDLGELDRIVRRAELADGLADAVQRIAGPVTDRRALAARRERRWAQVLADAHTRVAGRPALADWLADVSTGGLLRRLSGGDPAEAERILARVLAVADRLPATPAVTLAELAAAVLGDSHALDPGQPTATLAVRAAARVAGIALTDDANGRRDAWAAVGVLCDELSTTVLVLNLHADDTSVTGQVLAAHAACGEPARLTLRQLLRHPPRVTASRVFVCENPSVMAAAADRLGADAAPLICLEGNRKTAARTLLDLLATAGAELGYHGDFDWGGVRIGNLVMRDHTATPWRFTSADYRATTGGTHLTGAPVDATWDPALRPAMAASGRAVHEEQVLDVLLSDLAGA